MQDSSRAGETILGGKYRIERVIGEGAFGRVYLAHDVLLRRNVAVKELLAARNRTDPQTYDRYLERFEREARAAGRIEHPNIVSVYELAVDAEQNYYLVMQYVDGTNIRDLLVQVGTLPVGRAAAITLDVARALEAIHEQDIVHRDIKPANIMLTKRGLTKLTDFGIAQVGDESHRTQTVTGHPGTPMYMSLEQASGTGYLDGRSDIYSLGAVFYEMLTGIPYIRKRQPIREVDPEISVAVGAIIDKMLKADREARYQSATEVVNDLERLSSLPTMASEDVYRMPGAPPAPLTQPPPVSGWQMTGSASIPPVSPPMSGATIPADPRMASQSGGSVSWYPPPPPPQPWQSQPLPPPVPIPPPVTSRYVRAVVDGYGAVRYEVRTGRVVGRTFGALGIAVALWFVFIIIFAIVTAATGEDSVIYDILSGVAGITLLLLPVVPIVVFFVTRGKAKRAIRTMTYGNRPR